MKHMQQKLITDQNISQMISSYLIRNRDLLNTLKTTVACDPVPVSPRKSVMDAKSGVMQ